MRQYLLFAKVAGIFLLLVLLFRLNVSRNTRSTSANPITHDTAVSHLNSIATSVTDSPTYGGLARLSNNGQVIDNSQHVVYDTEKEHSTIVSDQEKQRADLGLKLTQAQREIATLRAAQKSTGPGLASLGSSVERASSKSYTTQSWSSDDQLIEHYVLDRTPAEPKKASSVLHLTITRDAESWGRNPAEAKRTIYDHLNMVTNTTLEPEQVSIGLLTADRKEYERYIRIFTPRDPASTESLQASDLNSTYFDFSFRRVTLILHMADTRAALLGTKGGKSDTSRESRHNIPQHERRAILAKLRNYLQFIALHDESHVAWLDSDVYKYSSDKIMKFMADKTRTTDDVEIGLLTARCRRGEPDIADRWLEEHPDFTLPGGAKDSDTAVKKAEIEEMRGKEGGKYEIMAHKTNAMGHYDLNAWSGRRMSPNVIQQEGLWRDISSWTPSGAGGGLVKMLDGVIDKTDDNDVRQLDSVGGTIIVIRADLIKMGLIFPTGYFVGMSFEHGEGFDGIETEGICLLSRSFSRDGNSTCYTLGGEWSVWHTLF